MLNIDIAQNVNYEMSFKQYLSSYEKIKTEPSKINYVDSLLKNLLRSEVSATNPANNGSELVFVRSMDRTDYNRILDDIKSIAPINSTFTISASNKGIFNIHFSRYLKDNITKVDFITHKDKYVSQIYKILFLFSCYKTDQLLKIHAPKKVVFFSDMQCFENFACQYLKLIGIKTATLQHGLYVEYNDEKNINTINYKHHISDYFLAWGKCTGDLVKKYVPNSKIIIVGKPSLSIKPYKEINKNHLLVVLDTNIFSEFNFKMIEIAQTYCQKNGIEWAVRFHPGNNKNLYYQKYPFLLEEHDKFHFNIVVGHTSSLLYEALIAGYSIAKFDTHTESIPTPAKYLFSSVNDLETIFSTHSPESDASYKRHLIDSYGIASLENYKQFLHDINW